MGELIPLPPGSIDPIQAISFQEGAAWEREGWQILLVSPDSRTCRQLCEGVLKHREPTEPSPAEPPVSGPGASERGLVLEGERYHFLLFGQKGNETVPILAKTFKSCVAIDGFLNAGPNLAELRLSFLDDSRHVHTALVIPLNSVQVTDRARLVPDSPETRILTQIAHTTRSWIDDSV